ncbi:hypothetical protein DFQ27_007567 [Actinomortierella ambigua]|uniref:Uncharacterized protein n=1 Tax=Actinomortierella ambigua TaxID=1343610 RepID=A0A9P6UD43_9FUNG|nr:hypothetical protein DFQ27_007567 [Actinomortierella ambigua]
MPDFKGKVLYEVFTTKLNDYQIEAKDISGKGRIIFWPFNWIVCTQYPEADAPLYPEVVVKVGVVRYNEACPIKTVD